MPFLGYEKLYQKFHLDEPWDSPHNRPLLNEMPLPYAPDEQGGAVLATDEGVFLIGSGKTFYQGVIRPGTAFDPAKPNGVSFSDIKDGTATILILEAGKSVRWTEPEDLVDVAEAPSLPSIGGLFEGKFNAILADGSVLMFLEAMDPAVFRALTTIAGGEVIDWHRMNRALVPLLEDKVKAKRAELDAALKHLREVQALEGVADAFHGEADSTKGMIASGPGAIASPAPAGRATGQANAPADAQVGDEGLLGDSGRMREMMRRGSAGNSSGSYESPQVADLVNQKKPPRRSSKRPNGWQGRLAIHPGSRRKNSLRS